VTVDSRVVGRIDEPGLVVHLGLTHDDGPTQVAWMARKIRDLRIRREEQSVADLDALGQTGTHVETGVLGADMEVALVNDGPVTLLLDPAT
jgi:D-tyrosyl-tRNA(Tyr) deacylase